MITTSHLDMQYDLDAIYWD